MMAPTHHIGKTFGRLIVIAYAGSSRGHGAKWFCQCSCGETKTVSSVDLRSGDTKSCGCLRREVNATRTKPTKHGKWGTPEHRTWAAIKSRCHSPTNKDYGSYGGRGISVCERWRGSFEAFFADMGPKPNPSLSIDRINNNGNYEPGNCRWATAKQQANNKRNNKHINPWGKMRHG